MTICRLALLLGVLVISTLPTRADDQPATEVLADFKMNDSGFESCLGRVTDDLYRGRTSAGGHAAQLDLDNDDEPDLRFDPPCDFLLQLEASQPIALETDRRTRVRLAGRTVKLERFSPVNLSPESE